MFSSRNDRGRVACWKEQCDSYREKIGMWRLEAGGRLHLARDVEGLNGPVAVEMATDITEVTQKPANH